MILPDWNNEKDLRLEGFRIIAGIDEAGRGPLVGSVVAAVAMVKPDVVFDESDDKLIRDSKSLSAKQREKAFALVAEHFYVGIGESSSQTIDRMNILEATFLAMKKAITHFKKNIRKDFGDVEIMKWILLVDGDAPIPSLSLPQHAIVQGDKTVKSIAAASIVAKVTRDRQMMELSEQFPLYGFDKHKGYGTKQHMEALRKYGPIAQHRFSFKPVKESVTMRKINRELS